MCKIVISFASKKLMISFLFYQLPHLWFNQNQRYFLSIYIPPNNKNFVEEHCKF